MPGKLTEEHIQTHLKQLDGWTREGDQIVKTYVLSSYAEGLAFASTIGYMADALNHHPDLLITWKRVTVTLSTHDVGGLSEKDFDLAQRIEALPHRPRT
ncbi:MAG: 4a-hydroxytetrahydrobiopterin dehydratase [Anaerolineae bacterium]|nr:4a-hydroxytetrahydrobiopterin dehydratase [Anaerolineae bacterium]